MTIIQILLILLILLLLIHIFLRLMIKSNTKSKPIIYTNIEEGLTLLPTPDKEFKSIEAILNDIPINNMQSINKDSTVLPLREYCIKSSYNSASTGNYVNVEMVKLLLKRGCRLFDFEILYKEVDEKFIPVVGFTTDINYNIIESKNTIPLDDVLIMIATNAYTDTSPNSKDPIFINLRIKSNDSAAYNAIAKSIHNFEVSISDSEGNNKAEVTVGGIDTKELSSKTMESIKIPGLYFVGEVVDVTGWLGGYNFQWAWSSGFVAGNAIS